MGGVRALNIGPRMMFVASSELVCCLKKKLLFFSDICVHHNLLAVISDVTCLKQG